MSEALPDAAAYSDWIGRSIARRDLVTARLAAEFEATLAPHLARADGTVPGLFWTLAPDTVPMRDLGHDGHPRTGLFLPALPFPRRMWAGGELTFHAPIRVGDDVVKTSVIDAITFKMGTTGPLGFITVRHLYAVGSQRVIEERQDLVYRPGASPTDERPKSVKADHKTVGEVAQRWEVATDPVMLARFSAVTFNGHRIHYDAPYATCVEGYAGIVVHGPLQATLMLNLAADTLGRLPRIFRYRGLTALICGTPFSVEAVNCTNGSGDLRVISRTGTVTMTGSFDS